MKQSFYYKSQGFGQLHGILWLSEGEVKAVVQIVHGIAEHMERYDHFARFLNGQGIAVVGEDHMGHGKSIGDNGIRGYFHGGWQTAVGDTYQLLLDTQARFPGVPFILLGHSMGSFMARTILAEYPESGIDGCILSGTAWQPDGMLKIGPFAANLMCRCIGEKKCSQKIYNMIFGGFNSKVEYARTGSDWLSRDPQVADAYEADPLCGFIPTAGLFRDMMVGFTYIQNPNNLRKMNKNLPVFFVAGEADPVGNYGAGVRETSSRFQQIGMTQVALKLYPQCRHEILNELNKEQVYHDLLNWILAIIK